MLTVPIVVLEVQPYVGNSSEAQLDDRAVNPPGGIKPTPGG